MVRKASADFGWRRGARSDSLPSSSKRSGMSGGVAGAGSTLAQRSIDLVLEHMRGAEDQHPPRVDRHFHAGLGIAADAFALAAHRKAAEGGNLDHLTSRQRSGNL